MNGRYRPVSLPVCEPGGPDPTVLIDQITTWVTSPAVRDLVALFDGQWPGHGTTAELLDYLEAFSAEHWDFRRGRERNLARTQQFDPRTQEVIREAAWALGLVDPPKPARGDYSHLVILGGLVRACLARPAAARMLLAEQVQVPEVTALSGFRPLVGDEAVVADTFGLERGEGAFRNTEFALMDSGMRRAFNLTGLPHAQGEGDIQHSPRTSWWTHSYRDAAGRVIRVVAAPSSEPELRRANTADTYRFWAQHIARLTPADRVLLVTSTIYVPFQHCDAIRTLGLRHGCGIDTVAVDPQTMDPALRQPVTSTQFLQEIRSAIRSLRALHQAVSDITESGSQSRL